MSTDNNRNIVYLILLCSIVLANLIILFQITPFYVNNQDDFSAYHQKAIELITLGFVEWMILVVLIELLIVSSQRFLEYITNRYSSKSKDEGNHYE
jgi:multisubunit Na+/H+ antiporter MnhB subunit